MTAWSVREISGVLVIGRRLGVLLLAAAVYYVAAGLAVQAFHLEAVDWGGAASIADTLILGLLMSFRNRVAYDRWWEARGLWGKLVNDSRNAAAKCAALLPADVLAASGFGAALAGFADALNRHLRGEPLRLRDVQGLAAETDDPAHVPLYLARRVFMVVAGWKREGRIDGADAWVLDAHLCGLLDVCGACEKIRNTPLSPSYKALLRTGLVLNVLVAPWLTVPEIGFWGVPPFLLACFFLFGVELIDTVVEEPFGRERDDLDLDRYCRTIRDGVRDSVPSTPDHP